MYKSRLIAQALVVASVALILIGEVAFSQSEDVSLERIVVTPNRFAEEVQKIPASVTVITAQQIKDSYAANTPQILEGEIGLVARDYYGNGTKASVDLRGFGETAGSNTLVLIDGRRVNEIDLSGVDWTQIPLDRIARIEILRGAAGAVLYGDNASGGVINIITKSGRGRPNFEFEAITGSYQMQKENFSFAGSLDKLSYFSSITQQSTNGYRENSYYRADDFFAKFIYDFTDKFSLGLNGAYHDADYGLPGALRESQLKSCSRRDSKFIDDDAGEEDWYILFEPKITFLDDNESSLPVSFRSRVLNTNWGSGGYGSNNQRIDTIGICPKVILRTKILNKINTSTLGLDFYKIDSTMHDFSAFGDQTGDADVGKKSIGVYFQDELFILDNLIGNFGYRYEKARYDFNYLDFSGFLNNIDDSSKLNEEVFNLGLAYNYKDGSRVFMNLARSFRFPITEEFMLYNFIVPPFGRYINKNLLPQRTFNYELGLNHKFNPRLEIGFTAFLTKIKNEIYYNPLTYINENYDSTQHRGIELSWNWGVLDNLTLRGNYAYSEAFFDGGVFNNNQIPAVPAHKAFFGLDWKIIEKWQLSTLFNYVGKQYFISDQAHNYPKLDDFITLDLKISYKLSKANFFIGLNNVFDEKYSEYGVISTVYNERGYYPSPGRNFILGGSVKF